MRSLAWGGAGLAGIILASCGGPSLPPGLADYQPPPRIGVDASTAADATVERFTAPTAAPGEDPTTCDEAAQLRSYVGCDYWPTVVANDVWSIFDFAVVVANAGAAPASVTVTGPGGTNQTQSVQPNSLTKFYLPWVPELKGPDTDTCGNSAPLTASVLAPKGAFHLVSSVPVTVYQFNALEYAAKGGPLGKDWSACPGTQPCRDAPYDGGAIGCYSFTNDSSLLLPTTAMTGNYRVTAYPGQSAPADGGLQPTMGSYFAITATADGTQVQVNLAPSGSIVAGNGIAATAAGGVIHLTLDAGDVAELAGDLGDTVDLSGSLVTANNPVQVIAGASCDQVPEGSPACDHLEQSVFPAETLGTQYIITTPTGPQGVPVGHVVRLYGNADGTVLTYAPAAPPGCPSSLDAGQVADCGMVSVDFEVSGTHEFAVGSFMLGGSIVDPQGGLGDPSESLIAAVEQFRTKYVFLAPSDYAVNFADVVVPVGDAVVLDGMQLDTSRAAPIGAGYGVVRVPLAAMTTAAAAAQEAHVLVASSPVGLQVLGYGIYTSYQYPGGLNLKQIAPPPLAPH